MSTPPEDHSTVRSSEGAGPRHKKNPPADKKRSGKGQFAARVLAWGGGLVSAALLAFITAYFTVLGNHAASAAPEPPAGEPIIAMVGNITEDSESMVLPRPVNLSAQQLSSLNASDGTPNSSYVDWFVSHKAAFVEAAEIQLVVQGNGRGLVQIVNITPVERCSQPLRGTLFYAPGQGQDVSAHLYYNLNDPQAPAGYTHANTEGAIYPDYFGHYTISLAFGKIFTFQITASVRNRYCQFTLIVAGIANGKTFTESVNNHGQPFRVTSLLPEPPTTEHVPSFAGYQDLYLGGIAAGLVDGNRENPYGVGLWVRANPKTYRDLQS
jgi:hypothetical protein